MRNFILTVFIILISISVIFPANISQIKILNADHAPVGGTVRFIGYLDGTFNHAFLNGTDTIFYEVKLYNTNNNNPLRSAKYEIYTVGIQGQIDPNDFVITWHSNGSYYQRIY